MTNAPGGDPQRLTYASWRPVLEICRKWVVGGFDERFRRLWRFHLASCKARVRSARIDVTNCPGARLRPPGSE